MPLRKRLEEELGPPPEMAGPPSGPLHPPEMGEPMMEEPMMEEMPMDMGMPGGEEELPSRGTIVAVDADTVTIVDEFGAELVLPTEALPFAPEEGMDVVQAEVVDTDETGIVAQLVDFPDQITLPYESLESDFQLGDLFWMPAPPSTPDMMEPDFMV